MPAAQLFYKTHILGFLGFMLFGFMHHTSLFAYTMPGTRPTMLCPAEFSGPASTRSSSACRACMSPPNSPPDVWQAVHCWSLLRCLASGLS